MRENRVEIQLELCDIADRYYEASKEPYGSELILNILGTLLDCESMLDHGRGIPMYEGDQTLLGPVHARLDQLRTNIHELMERIGDEKVVPYLEWRVRDKQREYSSVAQNGTEGL